MRRSFAGLSMLIFALASCTRTASSTGTGADVAAQAFFDAIIRKNWSQAFELVVSNSTTDGRQFAAKAEQFRRQLGFEPEQVVVRSCREDGDDATAHIMLKGHGHLSRDEIGLRKVDGTWRIVLPANFGAKR